MRVHPVAAFDYNSENPFDGILHYTYFKSRQQFFKLYGSLTLSASSYDDGSTTNKIYSIIGVDNSKFSSYFQTLNFENSWIEFEFKNIKVSVKQYTYSARTPDFFEKWQLQGSNDNHTWEIIDEQTYSYQGENYLTKNFYTCNQGNNNMYSFIRIITKGMRNSLYGDRHRLAIYGFELFGDVSSFVSFTFSHFRFTFHIGTLFIYFLI